MTGSEHSSGSITCREQRKGSLLKGFPPVDPVNAGILILGTMPGPASLAAGEYYAHPRNSLRHIIAEICDLPPQVGYDELIRGLVRRGIALWDVLHACQRVGSSDSGIDPLSVQANPIADFLSARPEITRLIFNGTSAYSLYRKFILKTLSREQISRLTCRLLPSTSPANARMTYREKADFWLQELGLIRIT